MDRSGPEVVLYTTMFCPFCVRAKQLLAAKGVEFQDIDVDITPGARAAMMQRSRGRRTVPQIFIGEAHIGGCNELYDLERRGKLDDLLKSAA